MAALSATGWRSGPSRGIVGNSTPVPSTAGQAAGAFSTNSDRRSRSGRGLHDRGRDADPAPQRLGQIPCGPLPHPRDHLGALRRALRLHARRLRTAPRTEAPRLLAPGAAAPALDAALHLDLHLYLGTALRAAAERLRDQLHRTV